jgi:hypothetical protein
MNQPVQNEDLRAIRDMMERSSRFLSLSGMSGIVAGLLAIAGAAVAWFLILGRGFEISETYFTDISSGNPWIIKKWLIVDASVVLAGALAASVLLSNRKALKSGRSLWNRVTARMLADLLIPLTAGGILCLVLLVRGEASYIVPVMLIFYGISLAGVSRLTFDEIRYLGLLEAAIGIIALFLPGYELLTWVAGFGILHIAYGIVIQGKYH